MKANFLARNHAAVHGVNVFLEFKYWDVQQFFILYCQVFCSQGVTFFGLGKDPFWLRCESLLASENMALILSKFILHLNFGSFRQTYSSEHSLTLLRLDRLSVCLLRVDANMYRFVCSLVLN